MPPPTRRRTRRQPRSPAAAALALSSRSHSGPSLDRSAYVFDSDEDYDSDMCADLPLLVRVSSKVRSALHAAWVDLEDAEGNYPHDDGHDLSTVDANLAGLAEFLVEMEEALNWFRVIVNEPDPEPDAATLVRMFSALYVEKPDEPGARSVGPRVLLEAKLVALSYTALFRECEPVQLVASLRVRRVRTSMRASLRAARMTRFQPTSGEALVCRAERLQAALDAALAQCGAQVASA